MTDKPVREAGVKNADMVTSNVNLSFTAGYNARQPEVDELRAMVDRLRNRLIDYIDRHQCSHSVRCWADEYAREALGSDNQ